MQADNTVLSMFLSGCFEILMFMDVFYYFPMLFKHQLLKMIMMSFHSLGQNYQKNQLQEIERPTFCISHVIAYPKLYLHWRRCQFLSLITGVTACL